MTQYYFSNGGQPQGPFTLTELTKHKISPEYMVWHKGMTDWQPARLVSEVHEFLSQAPPPLPPGFHQQSTPPPLPFSQPLVANPGSFSIQNKLSSIPKKGLWLAVGGVAVVALGLGMTFSHSSSASSSEAAYAGSDGSAYQPTQSKQEASQEARRLEMAADSVKQEAGRQAALARQEAIARREAKREWHRQHFLEYTTASVLPGYDIGFLGGISDGYVQFTNNSGYRLRNTVASITYIKANGGIYETKYVSFEDVAPHASVTNRIPDSDRGTSAVARVYHVEAPNLGFSYDEQRAEDAETAKADFEANP